jgi:hypothetical protein
MSIVKKSLIVASLAALGAALAAKFGSDNISSGGFHRAPKSFNGAGRRARAKPMRKSRAKSAKRARSKVRMRAQRSR